MPTVKLTKREVAKLRAPDPSRRQTLHWDTEVRGFGVLCSGVTRTRSYICQRDLPNGRTRRVTIGAVNEVSLDDAREEARDIIHALRKGEDPKQRGAAAMTLQEALDQYIRKPGLREKSIEGYRKGVERHLKSWLARPLSSLTREEVEAKHKAIAKAVAKGGRYSGRATANGVMRALRAIWNHVAERAPEIGPCPVRLKKMWFDEVRRDRLVKADELPAFYKAVRDLPNPIQRDYLLVLLFTGLRREEAASLRWEDVDLNGGVVRLPAKRTKAGRKFDVPITDIVRDILVTRRGAGDGEFLFPANSKSGHIAEPKAPLALVGDTCGVRVSAHDLRRTYATVAERTPGVSFLAVKALLNHALDDKDTTSGYVILSPKDLADAAQLIADRMKTLCAVPEPGKNVRKLGRSKAS